MLWALLVSVALFAGLLVGLEIGRRIGFRMSADKEAFNTGAADGVVFAVLGLIIAFTFSASASRFDERRRLIVEQADALGTASLRLDALEPADRAPIRRQMLRWTQLVLSLPPLVDDEPRLDAAFAEAAQVQDEVWRMASAAVEKKRQPELWSFVMPPLNDWIDLTTRRLAVNNMGAPPMVTLTVLALSLTASVLAGFHMSRSPRRSPLHYLAFAGILTLIVYVIFELNSPRSGFIRVDVADENIRQVEQTLRRSVDGG